MKGIAFLVYASIRKLNQIRWLDNKEIDRLFKMYVC